MLSPQKVAAILGFKQGGRNNMFEFLRNDGVLMSGGDAHNIPHRAQIEAGRFVVKESTWTEPETGNVHVNTKTLVSQKGLLYVHKRLKDAGHEPADVNDCS